ncbi:MAG TPA: ABC transporter permease [Acidobacteriota bacterium]|nr:ABC transporter permease [Acidobacteriota bacterium]
MQAHAIRRLRTRPGSSLFIIVGIGISVGLWTGAASSAAHLFSAPTAVDEPAELVTLVEVSAAQRQSRFSFPAYRFFRSACRSFSGVAASYQELLTAEFHETTLRVGAEFVSSNYFSLLGVSVSDGRSASPLEDGVVVTPGLAEQLYGASPAAGQKLLLNGHPIGVAGVLEEGFGGLAGGASTQVFLPLSAQPLIFPHRELLSSESARWLVVFGRLRAASGDDQAHDELRLLSPRLAEAGLLEANAVIQLSPHALLWSRTASEMAFVLTLAEGGALVAMLAVAVNLALILLAQFFDRSKETAVRMSLGASRSGIVLSSFGEMTLVAVLGSALGIALSGHFSRAIFALAGRSEDASSLLSAAHWDSWALAVLAVWLTMAAACLPVVFRASRISICGALGRGGTGTCGYGRRTLRARKLLVGAQVALCMALISGGVLLMQSLLHLQDSRVGGAPQQTSLTRIVPSPELQMPAAGQAAYLRILSRLEALPQVKSASLISHIPIGGGAEASTVSSRPRGDQVPLMADSLRVGPGFFRTMGLNLLDGRDFDRGDGRGSRRVAAVNQFLAARLWPKGQALGREMLVAGSDSPVEIIAIIENVKRGSLAEPAQPQVYLPFLQSYRPGMVIVARTTQRAAPLGPMIRKEIESAAPGVRFLESVSLQEHLDKHLLPVRLVTTTCLVLGCIVLLLSVGGLHANVSSMVTLRWREMGLRLAIGGSPVQAFGLVVREAIATTSLAAALGTGFAHALAGLLSHLLYGVRALNPLNLALCLSLVLLATAASALQPALRAAQLEPGRLLTAP